MNQYEAYKVNSLVNQYRANPDMFNDDQLDELEQLAEQYQINFKRNTSPFSLRRAMQQASAGFIEGFTTLDLMPKEPRNTGEAIFRQLGHLAGFAPSIMKVPIIGMAKAIGAFTGKKSTDILAGKITSSVMNGIDFIGHKSIPMIAQKKTQELFQRGLKRSGADALDYMKRGAKTRAIADEAVGLAGASAVSSIWKGPDVIIDSFIGGAIAGGAFGGIGNFANLSRFHKGTPEQIEQANKLLRMGLGSAVTGLPATLRGEPTEMQIYEYLLGGFFGYNARPVKEVEAGKYLLSRRLLTERDGIPETLDPTRSPRYRELSNEAKEYLLFDHPVPKDSKMLDGKPNSMGYGGTTGQALRYLEHFYPHINAKAEAKRILGNNASESQMRIWYGQKAGDLYKNAMASRINEPTKTNQTRPDVAMDFNDPVEIPDINVNKIAKKMFPSVKNVFTSEGHLAKRIIEHKDSSIKNNQVNTEQFISKVEKTLDRKLKEQESQDLRKWFISEASPMVESVYFTQGQNSTDVTLGRGAHKIGNNGIQIGERHNKLPIEQLTGEKFETMTHFVDKKGNAVRILDQSPDYFNKKLNYKLKPEIQEGLHRALFAEGKYVYGGVKSKKQLLIAPLKTKVDGVEITKEMLWDSMSKMGYEGLTPQMVRSQMEKAYNYGQDVKVDFATRLVDRTLSRKSFTKDMYEQIYVSNILHHAKINNLLPEGSGITRLHKLFDGRYMTNVADFNKRMQLLGNKMATLDPQSFADMMPDGNLKTIYIDDIKDLLPHMKLDKWADNRSLSDGGVVYSQRFTDRAIPSIGLPNASMFKPVHIGKGEVGTFATKSSGLRATDALQKFMDRIGVDAIVLGSAFKIKGNHKYTPLEYDAKTGEYSLKNEISDQANLFGPTQEAFIYNTPIKNIQISTGTFVNNKKSISGADTPIQLWNQFDYDHKGFQEAFMDWTSQSRKGSSEGKVFAEWADKKASELKGKSNEVFTQELQNKFETGKLDIRELPFDFLMKHLVGKDSHSKIGSFLFDKIQRLDLDIDTFKGDNASMYTDFNSVTDNIAQANINKYNSRLTIFKDDHLRFIKRFIISRYANPFIKEGGQAWLKPVTPDQIRKLDGGVIKEGHVYLDNNHKNTPAKLENRKMEPTALDNINEGLTLGKLWEFHTGKKSLPEGVTPEMVDNALDLVVIRVPSDSPSGTRVLRLGGFTNENGSGAITHSKDDYYLGGADKDSDYIKIFQSAPKKLKSIIKKEKDGKSKQLNDKEYNQRLEDQFIDTSLSAKDVYNMSQKIISDVHPKTGKKKKFEPTLLDDIESKMIMFDPNSRLMVAKRASSGQDGLASGLSSAMYLQGIADHVRYNGGKLIVEIPRMSPRSNEYLLEIEVNKDKIQEFRDLKAKFVNKSADASSDPTVKPYSSARDMFFNTLFKVHRIDKSTGERLPLEDSGIFKSLIESSTLKDIARAPQAVKMNNGFRSIDNQILKEWKSQGLLGFDGYRKGKTFRWIVHKHLVEPVGKGTNPLNKRDTERVVLGWDNPLITHPARKEKISLAKHGDVVMNIKYEKGKPVYQTLADLVKQGKDIQDYRLYKSSKKPSKPQLQDLEDQILGTSVETLAGKNKSYAVEAVLDMNKNLGITGQNGYGGRKVQEYRKFLETYINAQNPIGIDGKVNTKIVKIAPELHKALENQTKFLLKDLDIQLQSTVNTTLGGADRSYGLDIFGKTLGQFSTVEMLNKQMIGLEKHLIKTKSNKGYKKLTKQLYKLSNEAKNKLRNEQDKAIQQQVFDNAVKADVEAITNDLYKSNKNISPEPVLNMYYTMLMSPFTGKRKSVGADKVGVLEYKREIHGSDAIPREIKDRWYKTYDNLVEKMNQVREKTVDQPKLLSENIIKDIKAKKLELKDMKTVEFIRQALSHMPKQRDKNTPKKGTQWIDLMAVSGKDQKAIERFKEIRNENPALKDNFSEFFSWWSSSFGNQVPRSLKDFRMQDVYAMNEFFKRSGDPSDLAFTMKFFHHDPRHVDQHLISKGIAKAFYKYTFTNPTTGEKVKVFDFMSPVGAISNYTKNVKDRGIDIDTVKLKTRESKLFEYLNGLKNPDKVVKELFEWRENNKSGVLGKEAEALDILTTKFFKSLGDNYIYTKNAKGEKYANDKGDWKLDKDFSSFYKDTKGNLNQYMHWKKDGTFNFEKFFRKVVEVNLDKDPVDTIRKLVGVDGAKRYLYEMDAFTKLGKDYKSKILEHRAKNPYKGIGFMDPAEYMPHMNFNKTEGARKAFADSIAVASDAKYKEVYEKARSANHSESHSKKLATHAKNKFIQHMENLGNFSSEMLTAKDIMDIGEKIDDSVLDKQLSKLGMKLRIGPLEGRTANLQGYDKSKAIYNDYIDKVIGGYYKALSAIHGDRQIQKMKATFKNRKTPEKELKHFEDLYKIDRRQSRRSDDSRAEVSVPLKNRRYKNYVDVWADYIKLHLQTVLGHQTYFPEQIMSEISRGIDPLHLKSKRNLFWMTSDQNMVSLFERMWQSKRFTKVPFVKGFMNNAPDNPSARKEYFSRKIHEFGRMEAQYELMTLLANTATYATNIVSGNIMTGASSGTRNFMNIFSKKKVYDRLLTENGKEVIKTLDGKTVRNRKQLTKWLEEQGIIDNFIQHEFEYNEGLKLNLKKAGINIKNFKRDLSRAMREKKGVREESPIEVASRYGVKDVMLKYGSFFMRHSEKVNRVNSYMAHAMQAIEKFGPQARELSLRDSFVHEQAMKGIEGTQFLYQNSFRPMFMRTATGKVLTRFKLFAWNSIRTRREFYKQAKLYGFKEGSEEYNRAKDLFLTDMFMMALGGAFMFSIFDTSLAPPYDWIQSLADWMYGDKKERDMAFYGSKLGPVNLLKPPIARVPEAMGQILTGDWEQFSGYTAYTLFPFGRMARQVNQLTDDRVGRGLERAPEILVRFPYNQIQSRIERAKRRADQSEVIEDMLGS